MVDKNLLQAFLFKSCFCVLALLVSLNAKAVLEKSGLAEITAKKAVLEKGGLAETTAKKDILDSSLDISHTFYSTSNDLFQGSYHPASSVSSDQPKHDTGSSEISSRSSFANKTLLTMSSNPTTVQEANVTADASFIQPDEPEECVGDDSSAEDKEMNFIDGVHMINDLSKDLQSTNNNATTQKHGKENKKKRKKKKDDDDVKKEFNTNIDLEYVNKLVKGKNLKQFQEKYEQHMKNKSFEDLKHKLYDKQSKLKLLEAFDTLDRKTERNLNKLVEETIQKEESSIRYQIHFPLFYHAVGTITLPVDDLVEPFETWYAGELNMSRIDYYYGMDKSYQRGDIGKHGVIVKLTPAHWGKKSDLDKTSISCWYKEESKWTDRRAQTVIPMNIKKFKFEGEDHFNGVPAYKFTFQKSFVHKNNTYIFHVTKSKPYKPLRYEMIGYDHLLRSHYDHYIIDYFSFDAWDFDYKVLQIPKKYKCYKQLQKMKSHFEANPMWEFLHGEDPGHREQVLNDTYEHYKTIHGKLYNSHVENHKRKDIFRHNARFVNSHNRAKLNFTLELNHLSDISDEEFEMMKGQPDVDQPEMQQELNDIPQLRLQIPTKPLPKQLDWRDYGIISAVHSQSFCASCWAFSAVGAVEAAFALQNGSLEELSVQELIDCSWPYDNNGCRGGWSWRALKFVGEHGIATRRSYGKYLGQEGYCHCGKKDNCDSIKKMSYRTIEKHDREKLKLAIAMFGAGSVSVQCARKTFKFYSSGIYDDPKCGQKTDHAVVVVGYGEEKGIPYWLIKNSWGQLWGNKGYIKISMKEDLCGVLHNGALMVSMGNWKDLEAKGFAFEKLHKQQTESQIRLMNHSNFVQNLIKQEEPDLFSLPDHVVQYLQKQIR